MSKQRPEVSRRNAGEGGMEIKVLAIQRLLLPRAPSLLPHCDLQEYRLLRFPAVHLMEFSVSELHLKCQISVN